jgi:hypothetical protein
MEYPSLLTESISDVFAEVSNTSKMTALDREMLQAALLDEFTTEEEKQAIDRLLYAVRLGRIQVIEHA